jgi:N-methylhydantoinase A
MARALGHENIITTDIGGTTFLVGMIVDGQPLTSTTTVLNQHTLNLPMVSIHTIGSGGGAIAWLDSGDRLRVGPRSAGASPGPACYGEGGTEPTVTDVDLVLGILDPDFFLGGRKALHRELAEEAIRSHIAEPLGMTVEEAATAIYEIQNAQTADLLRRVVVDAGFDPRDFVVYSFGGAGPVHCAGYSADLGVREIVVPLGSTASAFSAYGLATADVVLSAEKSDPRPFPPPADEVQRAFDDLEEQVVGRLNAQGIPFDEVVVRREADLRYSLQLAEAETPVASGPIGDAEVAAIGETFEELYARRYGKGAGFREAGIQIITYRVFAEGRLGFPTELPAVGDATTRTPEPKTERRMLLDGRTGWAVSPVYDAATLREGHTIEGPAVVEASTTTVVIPNGARGDVDRLGNIIIHFMRGSEDADSGSWLREVRA